MMNNRMCLRHCFLHDTHTPPCPYDKSWLYAYFECYRFVPSLFVSLSDSSHDLKVVEPVCMSNNCSSDESIDFSDEEDTDVCMEVFDEIFTQDETVTTPINETTNVTIEKTKKKQTSPLQLVGDMIQVRSYTGELSPAMVDDYTAKLESELLRGEQKLELVEGVTMCLKCKSRKVYTYQMQTRSGDEAMTTFYVCSVCAAKWKS